MPHILAHRMLSSLSNRLILYFLHYQTPCSMENLRRLNMWQAHIENIQHSSQLIFNHSFKEHNLFDSAKKMYVLAIKIMPDHSLYSLLWLLLWAVCNTSAIVNLRLPLPSKQRRLGLAFKTTRSYINKIWVKLK